MAASSHISNPSQHSSASCCTFPAVVPVSCRRASCHPVRVCKSAPRCQRESLRRGCRWTPCSPAATRAASMKPCGRCVSTPRTCTHRLQPSNLHPPSAHIRMGRSLMHEETLAVSAPVHAAAALLPKPSPHRHQLTAKRAACSHLGRPPGHSVTSIRLNPWSNVCLDFPISRSRQAACALVGDHTSSALPVQSWERVAEERVCGSKAGGLAAARR